MFEDDIQPQRQIQRVGSWLEQRRDYRLAALVALRKRENLPQPVDQSGTPLETRMDDFGNVTYHSPSGEQVTRVLFAGTGKEGKPGSFAIGSRKGEDRELADAHWGSPATEGISAQLLPKFEILDIAEDGRLLIDELHDLDRDATGMEAAQRVSHGSIEEQAPGFDLNGTSDEEVDQKLQEYLKREGKRG